MTDQPRIPKAHEATTDEGAYQIDAARSMLTAARSLRIAADRIEAQAAAIAELGTPRQGLFPYAGRVRDAMGEIRNLPALLYLDSALGSAMLADRERAMTTPPTKDTQ